MTRERAIQLLEYIKVFENGALGRDATGIALDMAIAALREQAELESNLKVLESSGCEYCNETLKRMPNILAVADYYQDDTVYEPKFCPMCGRRL